MYTMKRTLFSAVILLTATLLTSCRTSSSLLPDFSQNKQSVPATSTTTSEQPSDIIGSGIGKLLGTLLGGTTLNQESILGTWHYKGADCVFKTENLLLKAGGEVAAAKVEEKLNTTLAQLGITGNEITFTFNADNTYEANIKGTPLQGTYSLDLENKKITLTYLNGIGTITPQIALSGNTLSLLYDADKLLKFLTKVSALTNNATLTSLSTLLESYDGMLIGWEMQK